MTIPNAALAQSPKVVLTPLSAARAAVGLQRGLQQAGWEVILTGEPNLFINNARVCIIIMSPQTVWDPQAATAMSSGFPVLIPVVTAPTSIPQVNWSTEPFTLNSLDAAQQQTGQAIAARLAQIMNKLPSVTGAPDIPSTPFPTMQSAASVPQPAPEPRPAPTSYSLARPTSSATGATGATRAASPSARNTTTTPTFWEVVLMFIVTIPGLLRWAAILVIAIVIIIAGCNTLFPPALTEHSTCQQFRDASYDQQTQVLQQMLAAHHDNEGVGSARLSLGLYCNLEGPNAPIDGVYNG